MRPPRDWREARRLRAWELKWQGWKQRTIAAAPGVTPVAVSQWLTRAAGGGVEAVRNRIRPGPTPRFTPE
jgi:predicted transcriptional regulator